MCRSAGARGAGGGRTCTRIVARQRQPAAREPRQSREERSERLSAWAKALRVKDDMIKVAVRKAGSLPLVFAHGMGDSCFNPGMAQVTDFSGQYLGVYSTCIGDGDNQPEDTTNGFFMNMNKQVEHFAAKVRADAKLSKGFSAIGLSQGTLVIRGYIERFNDPPVHGFLSINGPLAGTASLPRCNPEGWVGYLCKKATDLVGDAAYSALIQDHIAQANFLKIPGENEAYLASNTFLPFLNNEVDHKDATSYKTRFASLSRLVLVKAKKDTMIFPRETAWFAYFDDESFEHLLPFNQTKAYVSDAFGLRTLAKAGSSTGAQSF
ncbi:Palmitoyl-protein thioesterase 1 [Hondaea fermentalgiana]|uniref:Palmitoyl-protein thioesterase 1 n=1 Tax=Hondaea fermentalgiana TaxID=2315210 RepID=A0A2R5GBP3_9STRA|nr:Palmitoyl-protein thioesterase 1 [Hondaea fermentalgiana]|eukprot:GBG25164.1 Palmitoyl-protein thioesterase 1 [Hondaea fermentalgiana]